MSDETRRRTIRIADLCHTQRILTVPGQDGFGYGNTGDCTRAALASAVALIEEQPIEYDSVPHVGNYPDGFDEDTDPLRDAGWGRLWWRASQRWLAHRHLLLFGEFDADALDTANWYADQAPEFRWALGSVQSSRGDFTHSVVVDLADVSSGQPDIVWDPHPAGDAYGMPLKGWTPFGPIEWAADEVERGHLWCSYPPDDPMAEQIVATAYQPTGGAS